MKKSANEGRYMGSVKVGPKGQIVIPKEVREAFHIEPGDTLMILSDVKKGIALERYDVFAHIADAIFNGQAHEKYPDKTEEDARHFAEKIRSLGEKPVSVEDASESKEEKNNG